MNTKHDINEGAAVVGILSIVADLTLLGGFVFFGRFLIFGDATISLMFAVIAVVLAMLATGLGLCFNKSQRFTLDLVDEFITVTSGITGAFLNLVECAIMWLFFLVTNKRR